MDQPLKELHGKKKIEHIWTYYKPLVFGILLALIFAIYGIVRMIHPSKATALTLMVVDSPMMTVDPEEAFPGFSEAVLDPDYEKMEIDVTMHLQGNSEQLNATNLHILTARFLTGEIDLFAADPETTLKYAEGGAFVNPEDYLTEEEQEVLEPYYFRDSAGTPIGISLKSSKRYADSGVSAGETILAQIVKCSHPEAAHSMVEYLFEMPYQEE